MINFRSLRQRLCIVALAAGTGLGPFACTGLPGGRLDTKPGVAADAEPAMAADNAVRMQVPPATAPAAAGPLRLTMTEAVFLTLENNRALAVERITPPLRQTFENQERAVFDPSVTAEFSAQRTAARGSLSSGSGWQNTTANEMAASLAPHGVLCHRHHRGDGSGQRHP